MWFFPCVPCGKISSCFFYHKVHKAGWVFSLVSLLIKFLAIFLTTKCTKVSQSSQSWMDIIRKALCPLCFPFESLVVKFLAIFSTTKFTRIYTKFTKLDGFLSIALCPLWFFLCVPCGKTSCIFFNHKVHKGLHKVHKARWVFSAKPCVPCGIFIVILVVKLQEIFFNHKVHKGFTKLTKLDG